MFKKANKYMPCLNIKKTSKPNVENVLKPPQKPVKTKIFRLLFVWPKCSFAFMIQSVIPKTTQATVFETNVAKGKEVVVLKKAKPITYLSKEPTPPPIKTSKKFINLSYNSSNLMHFLIIKWGIWFKSLILYIRNQAKTNYDPYSFKK